MTVTKRPVARLDHWPPEARLSREMALHTAGALTNAEFEAVTNALGGAGFKLAIAFMAAWPIRAARV